MFYSFMFYNGSFICCAFTMLRYPVAVKTHWMNDRNAVLKYYMAVIHVHLVGIC